MMKNIFLHVGQYKTGTTALQKYLLENMDYLETHGIFFCSSYRYFKSKRYHYPNGSLGFVFNFLDKDMSWYETKQDEIELILEKTLQDIKNTICPTVLISSEHLFDIPTENLKKIRDLLTQVADNVYVIMYLRDLIPYVNSSYIQRVTAGNLETIPFETFLKSCSKKPELQYDYYKNVKRFESVFSKEKLIIKHYGSNLYSGNIVKDFFQILGKEIVRTVGNENSNPSATVAECFRRLCIEHSGKRDISRINRFIRNNIALFQFGSRSYIGASSAKLLENNFQEDHKKISNEFGIPLAFEYNNLKQNDLKLTNEETGQFVQLIKHLL